MAAAEMLLSWVNRLDAAQVSIEDYIAICEIVAKMNAKNCFAGVVQAWKQLAQMGNIQLRSVETIVLSVMLEKAIPSGIWRKPVLTAAVGKRFIDAVADAPEETQTRAALAFLRFSTDAGEYACCLFAVALLNAISQRHGVHYPRIWRELEKVLGLKATSNPGRTILHEICLRKLGPLLRSVLIECDADTIISAARETDSLGESCSIPLLGMLPSVDVPPGLKQWLEERLNNERTPTALST